MAGFTDREDEDPEELRVIEGGPTLATPAASRTHACNCCLPETRHPDQAKVTPIGCRCAASPSTWHRLPTIATKHCPTLAPLSASGRLQRSRRRQPGRTGGDRAPQQETRGPDQTAASPICHPPGSWDKVSHVSQPKRQVSQTFGTAKTINNQCIKPVFFKCPNCPTKKTG